jgi:hypothetical protein
MKTKGFAPLVFLLLVAGKDEVLDRAIAWMNEVAH